MKCSVLIEDKKRHAHIHTEIQRKKNDRERGKKRKRNLTIEEDRKGKTNCILLLINEYFTKNSSKKFIPTICTSVCFNINESTT